MKPSEILIAAKEKINTPEKWTRGAPARDKYGDWASPTESRAVCWSSVGAIDVSTKPGHMDNHYRATSYFDQVVNQCITGWNDDSARTHKEVMLSFDEAIELAKSKGD